MCKHRLAACDMLLEVQWTVHRMHLKCHKFMRHVEYLGRAAQNILSNLKLPAGFDLSDLATQDEVDEHEKHRTRILAMAKDEVKYAANLCRGNVSAASDEEALDLHASAFSLWPV